MREFNNILLIQTAFIGDVVLTTPMIRSLRKRMNPQARLTVMVKPEAAAIAGSLPEVDEVLIFDKGNKHKTFGMFSLISEIRNRHFDLLLSPHQSHRTGLVAMFSAIPYRYGYNTAGFHRLAYTHRLRRPKEMPEIHRLLTFLKESVAKDLDLETENDIPYLCETEKSKEEALNLLKELNVSRPVLLGCSSVWETKRWTSYGFASLAGKLIKKYKTDVLLVGGPADSEINKQVLDFTKDLVDPSIRHRIHDVAGRTSLTGLYSLMKRSLLLVSNDSAPVHFGCAAEIPVVAIFGPTVPELGYAPIAPGTTVAGHPHLSCRPCSTHGGRKCPLDHFKCMRELSPDMVLEKVQSVMKP